MLPINGIISLTFSLHVFVLKRMNLKLEVILFVQLGKRMLQWAFQKSPSTHLFWFP